ncbi:glutamyl-tRNA amidotransferase [uncultured Succinatimonas sp.]|uniref:allophanate hydrolase-related protein n=1 Tax=uncultured Succinatimonas sp. TaxID=1262973 RepID=UPI0025DEEB10|nr:glutamyl-tRNA amidotransferase [uncultured Succinatimonas sp.]
MSVLLAVNGTLMRGLELCKNMEDAGAKFVKEDSTAPCYRLWSVNDNNPAMLKVKEGGISVLLEVWSVPKAGLADILQKEPPGLCIGKVQLNDGSYVLGVIAEPWVVEGMKDISQYRGWRNYIASNA